MGGGSNARRRPAAGTSGAGRVGADKPKTSGTSWEIRGRKLRRFFHEAAQCVVLALCAGIVHNGRMELHTTVDRAALGDAACLAESGEFALYALGRDSYLLVQRHEGTPWSGVTVSGDGVFRIGGLFVDAMRHLYRDMALDVSMQRHERAASS